MRTLLIMPPYPITEFPTIPMGMAYVAAALRQKGKEAQIEDFLVGQYSKEKLQRRIEEYQPDIVGITSVTLNYPAASAILKDVKDINDNIVTIFGGPHVTFSVNETLAEAPWIDIIARGESDYTLVDITNGIPLNEIQGIAFKNNGEVTITPTRPWLENLDELAEPARDLFPVSKYRALGNECGLISSRGCPFGCSFCVGHKMVGRRGRFRDPKLVVDEIENILELGFKTVNIVDDLLTVNKEHVYAICAEMMARKLNIGWTAFSRVDTVSKDLLATMKEAGCFFILYGVESGNQEILNKAHKKITPQKTVEAVELAREAGIRTLASFIIGLPGETKETLAETVSFAKSLNTHYGFHLLSPFPGTEVRERAQEWGLRILTNDWSKYDANEAIVETDGASADDLMNIDCQYKEDVDRYIARIEELQKEGKDPDYEGIHIKDQKRNSIAAILLQSDIIENLGTLENESDSIHHLAGELADYIPYSPDDIEPAVKEMIAEGLLTHETSPKGVVWNWAH